MARRKTNFTYEHPRPAVTLDIVLFRLGEDGLETLLIERGQPPFAGRWAFPGGFLDVGPTADEQGEELREGAERELEEETGLPREAQDLRPFGVFGKVGRDPRGRTITVAYTALLSPKHAHRARAGDDAAQARWLPVRNVLRKRLAFDHDEMLRAALDDLEERVLRGDGLRPVLPKRFTTREYRAAAMAVLERRFDEERHRRAFARAKQDGWIVERGDKQFGFGRGRSARSRR